MELSKQLKEKIHIVEPELYEQYSLVSLLDSCVTNSQRCSRIHLQQTYLKEAVEFAPSDVVLTLRLSAMYWRNWNGGHFYERTSDNTYRVCFATHNSLGEIKDFLTFLKPKTVNLNVVPESLTEKIEMTKLLSDIQKTYQIPPDEVLSTNAFRFNRLKMLTSRDEAKKRKL